MKQNRKSYEISQKVLKFIKSNELIAPGSHITVGLSGGADSVCLLHILNSFIGGEVKTASQTGESGAPEYSLRAVHVHHGIREASADADAEFAKRFCNELNIPIEIVYRDIPKEAELSKETLEECARKARYEIFHEMARDEKDLIAVAHHVDDQAETVLFRMARGTGIKGLRAMLPCNGIIIRPLLCLTREEIMQYIDEQNLSYCIDETNDDTDYSRNRIRHNVMPELKALYPEAASHIALLSEDAKEADDFLNECALKLYEDALIESSYDKIIVDAEVLKQSKPIIIRMAVREIINSLVHSLKDVTREHVESVTELLGKNEYSSVDLPKRIKVVKEGGRLIFTAGGRTAADAAANIDGDEDKIASEQMAAVKEFCCEIEVPGRVELPDGRILITEYEDVPNIADIPQNIYTKWLDYDKINAGFCVRTRREGDYIIADSAGSHKSISRYMIDCKIPKSERDQVLLAASGSEVYWVIGYRISEIVKVNEMTCHTIKMEIKENENG